MQFLVVLLYMMMVASPVEAQVNTSQHWRDSLAVLNDLIRREPQSVDLRLRKAAVNIELGQLDYAAEEYGRVLELDPDNLTALYFRAYVYNQERRFDLARNDYEAILSRVPRHFEAQLGLAMVKRQMGRTAEVVDDLNQLVQMFPDSAVAYAARAGFEREQQKLELALYDWDEAIRLAPGNAEFVVSKVDVLLMLKRKKEARREIESAIRRGLPRGAFRDWIERCR